MSALSAAALPAKKRELFLMDSSPPGNAHSIAEILIQRVMFPLDA